MEEEFNPLNHIKISITVERRGFHIIETAERDCASKFLRTRIKSMLTLRKNLDFAKNRFPNEDVAEEVGVLLLS